MFSGFIVEQKLKHRAQCSTVVAWQCPHGGKPERDHFLVAVLDTPPGWLYLFLFVLFGCHVHNETSVLPFDVLSCTVSLTLIIITITIKAYTQ